MNTLGRLYNLIQNQMPAQTLEDITSIMNWVDYHINEGSKYNFNNKIIYSYDE